MRDFFLVGGGGFAGSVLRFYFGSFIFHLYGAPRFPVATLIINIVGCFLIGIISGAAEYSNMFSPQVRLLLLTGFLGGFTTFSAFGFETYNLARGQQLYSAFINIVLHIVIGLFAVWLGNKLVEMFANG